MRQIIRSLDGTEISCLVEGAGPAIVLVDGALCWTEAGVTPSLLPVLSEHFTVYAYDRRGRGKSGDTQPYAPRREYEDLAATAELALQSSGEAPYICGFSSGAALAFYAVAEGFANPKSLILYEAPFTKVDDAGSKLPADPVGDLKKLLAVNRRKEAVNYFMSDLIGMPRWLVSMMNVFMRRNMSKSWSVAHTLPYDIRIMDQTRFGVPREAAARISVPTFVIYGEKTAPALAKSAKAQAEAIPGAKLVVAEKSSHMVKPDILTAKLVQLLQNVPGPVTA